MEPHGEAGGRAAARAALSERGGNDSLARGVAAHGDARGGDPRAPREQHVFLLGRMLWSMAAQRARRHSHPWVLIDSNCASLAARTTQVSPEFVKIVKNGQQMNAIKLNIVPERIA